MRKGNVDVNQKLKKNHITYKENAENIDKEKKGGGHRKFSIKEKKLPVIIMIIIYYFPYQYNFRFHIYN